MRMRENKHVADLPFPDERAKQKIPRVPHVPLGGSSQKLDMNK
jgi:hypothetical protein